MALDPSILRVLQAKGVDVDTILSVIEADHAKDEARMAEKRAKAATQKRVYRANLRANEQQSKSDKSAGLERTPQDIAGHCGLNPSPDKESPHTPKKTNPIPVGDRSAREALWERFWATYPKRPGNPKQPAQEKFFRLLKSGVDGEEIIAGAERYAVSRVGQDPQFTCTASVFLNQGRWKDEHSPMRPPPDGGTSPPRRPAGNAYTRPIFEQMRSTDEQSPRDNIIEHPSAFAAPRGAPVGGLGEGASASLFGGSPALARRYANT